LALSGRTPSYAYAINDTGTIVGSAYEVWTGVWPFAPYIAPEHEMNIGVSWDYGSGSRTLLHWREVLDVNDYGLTTADFDSSFAWWSEESILEGSAFMDDDSRSVSVFALNNEGTALAWVYTYTNTVTPGRSVGDSLETVFITRRETSTAGYLAPGSVSPTEPWFRKISTVRWETSIDQSSEDEVLEDVTEGNRNLIRYKLDDTGRSLGRVRSGLGYDGPSQVYLPGSNIGKTVTGAVDWLTDISWRGTISGGTTSGAALWLEGGDGKRIDLMVPPDAGIGAGGGKTFATAVNDTLTDRVWVVGQVGGEMSNTERRWAGGHAVAWLSSGPLDSENLTWTFIDVAKGQPEGWSSLTLLDVNYHGQACGFALVNGEWTAVRVTLAPKLIAFDLNRDGKIDVSDPEDRTTAEKQFRFWLNDDQDVSRQFGPRGGSSSVSFVNGEVVPPNRPDNSDLVILTTRDLEDFERIKVKLPADWKDKIAAGYTLELMSSGPGEINLFLAVEHQDERDYLFNEEVARRQIANRWPVRREQPIGPRHAVNPARLHEVLQPEHFEKGEVLFLFEGKTEGPTNLRLQFIGPDDRLHAADEVHLVLASIRDFFEGARATPVDGFQPPYQTGGRVPSVGWQTVHEQRMFPEGETDQMIVFAHGWRMPALERQNWSEIFYKRLNHAGYRGRFAAFSWPTLSADESVALAFFTFNPSEHRGWKAGGALADYLGSLKQRTGFPIQMVAHSMGALVGAEALRQGAPVDNYVMMQGALSASCFDTQNGLYIREFTDRENQAGTPDLAGAFGYRNYLAGVNTNIVNFYNEQDFALRTGATRIYAAPAVGLAGDWGLWEVNNILFKPQPLNTVEITLRRPFVRVNQLGPNLRTYAYRDGTPGIYQFGFGLFGPGWNPLRPPRIGWSLERQLTDPHESMAFLARSRTRAVGGESRTGGKVGGSVNLNGQPFRFGPTASDHSAQFNRSMQEGMKDFYEQLLRQLTGEGNP
jgi:hypothetical protein